MSIKTSHLPMQIHPLADDLDFILDHTTPLWEQLRNKAVFITGGTGFFGCWLLESFLWANHQLNLNAKACVLTRDREAFLKKQPRLAMNAAIDFIEGDVKNFIFPESDFSHVIHAAADAGTATYLTDPAASLAAIVEGTIHTLDFALYCHAEQFLLVSSGAVYGRQHPELSHMDESYSCDTQGSPDRTIYARAKQLAEEVACRYAYDYDMQIKIARCFAFVGPYLPLDGSFAIGNFIRDSLAGEPIVVKGDGTPCRSYLYAADLVIWLLTILMQGETCRPYNVGSEEAISITDLAAAIANTSVPPSAVEIQKPALINMLPERYIPSTMRAQHELGLKQRISLTESVHKTKRWHTVTHASQLSGLQYGS